VHSIRRVQYTSVNAAQAGMVVFFVMFYNVYMGCGMFPSRS